MEDHCKGGWHAQAAEFPSIHRIGGGGCDACAGADRDIGARTGERRNEQRRIDPGLFPHLASPVLSLVRPGPVTNRSRWPQPPEGASGSLPPLPPGVEGVSDYDQLVG